MMLRVDKVRGYLLVVGISSGHGRPCNGFPSDGSNDAGNRKIIRFDADFIFRTAAPNRVNMGT